MVVDFHCDCHQRRTGPNKLSIFADIMTTSVEIGIYDNNSRANDRHRQTQSDDIVESYADFNRDFSHEFRRS